MDTGAGEMASWAKALYPQSSEMPPMGFKLPSVFYQDASWQTM